MDDGAQKSLGRVDLKNPSFFVFDNELIRRVSKKYYVSHQFKGDLFKAHIPTLNFAGNSVPTTLPQIVPPSRGVNFIKTGYWTIMRDFTSKTNTLCLMLKKLISMKRTMSQLL